MHEWSKRMLLRHYLQEGVGKTELARRFGVSRRTIHYWIESGKLARDLVRGQSRYTPRPAVASKLDPYKGIIGARLQEFPKLSAQRLFDEVRATVERDAFCGYRLHRADAAVNKMLAMAGRVEVRDFVDILHLDAEYLSLGARAWAACGKDPGFNPGFLLDHAAAHTAYRSRRPRATASARTARAANDEAAVARGAGPGASAGESASRPGRRVPLPRRGWLTDQSGPIVGSIPGARAPSRQRRRRLAHSFLIHEAEPSATTTSFFGYRTPAIEVTRASALSTTRSV